jgi:hypothetical protein
MEVGFSHRPLAQVVWELPWMHSSTVIFLLPAT